MKPFNLERALAGDPVINAEGDEHIEFRHLPSAKPSYQVVCVRKHDATLLTFTPDGCDTVLSPPALFMAPKKRMVWVCIYEFDGKPEAVEETFDTEADARYELDKFTFPVGTYPIEIEE